MKNLRRILASVLAFSVAAPLWAGVDPAYVKIKIYEMRLSENADCSNSVSVMTDSNPSLTDLTANPTFGSGAIANGTYQCVMIKVSDQLHFQPATNDGSNGSGGAPSCLANTGDYSSDIAHGDQSTDPVTGVVSNTSDNVEDLVWVYFRTAAPSTQNGGAFTPTIGIPMTSPLVISGDTAATVVFNFDGKIGEGQDNGVYSCGCEAPVMSFR